MLPARKAPKSPGTKRRRASSSDSQTLDPTATEEQPGKKRRQAALKASETITSIASEGRRRASTNISLNKKDLEMGSKNRNKGNRRDDDEMDLDNPDTLQRPRTPSPKKGGNGKDKSKGRKGRSNDDVRVASPAKEQGNSSKSSKKSKRGQSSKSTEPTSSIQAKNDPPPNPSPDHDSDDDERPDHAARAPMGANPFARSAMGALFGFGGGYGMGGAGAGMSARFSDILRQMKHKDDPTMQQVALQELSEILSMATGKDCFSFSDV